MEKKRIFYLILTWLSLMLFMGCEQFPGLAGNTSAPSGVLQAVQMEDGRWVDGYLEGRIGDTMTNTFFSYTVNDAWLSEHYQGQSPESGSCYLIADIAIKNVFGQELNMWSSDFELFWGPGDEEYTYPIANFSEEQHQDEFVMKRGETIQKLCVYEVPFPQGEVDYTIWYYELYDDEVYGNAFYTYFELDPAKVMR